jgi:hypothetical protein
MKHDDSNLQHEINALRTSQRWATLLIVIVIVAGLTALVGAVDRYFGGDGVRILLIAAGVAAVIGVIYALSIVTAAIYGRMAMQHHDNVLSGLIAFQRADDYGEVARQVAGGITNVMRSGTNLDARVLTVANQIAQQQHRQLIDSQRQQAQAPTWAMSADQQQPADQGDNIRWVD